MAEKLLGVQRANPQGAAQPGAEDVQVALEPLEGVEPGPLLLGDPMLESQQEVLVDLAGRPEGRGENGRRLKEGAVLEVGLPPAVVHQPAHRIGKVTLARIAGSGLADRVEMEGPGGDEGAQRPAELGRQGIELLVGRGVAVGALEGEGRRQGAVLVEDDPLRLFGDHEGPRQQVDEAAATGLEVAEPVDEPPQAEAEAEHHGGKDGHLRSAFPRRRLSAEAPVDRAREAGCSGPGSGDSPAPGGAGGGRAPSAACRRSRRRPHRPPGAPENAAKGSRSRGSGRRRRRR